MNLATAGLWLLIAAVAAGTLDVLSPRKPGKWLKTRRMTWWKLRPVAQTADPAAAQRSVSGLRKRRRKIVATIVRVGTEHSSDDLWLGVSSVNSAETLASTLAHSAGCELGEQSDPPHVIAPEWFLSKPISYEEGAEPDPMTVMRLEQSEFETEFPAFVAEQMSPGDAFVVSLRPMGDGVNCWALAATTCEALGSAWIQHGPLDTRKFPPSVAAIAAAAAGGFGALAAAMADRAGGQGLALTLGVVAAAIGLGLGGLGLIRPKGGRRLEAWGSLPLTRAALKDAAPVPSKLFAGWCGGGERTAVLAPQKEAPQGVTVETGACIGIDSQGRKCFIPDMDRQWGVFVCGNPGTGKTTLLLNLLLADSQFRAQGGARTVVWIETKGEGARRAEQVIRSGGIEPLVLKCASSEGNRLELLDWSDPERSAALLEGAVEYAFEAGDIMARSAEILRAVFQAALALPPEACRQLDFEGRPNVLTVAYWLLGGDTVNKMPEKTRRLVRQTCGEMGNLYLSYLDRSERDLRNEFDASKNKASNLLALSPLFEPAGRPSITLERMVRDHYAVVVDLSPLGEDGGWTDISAQRAAAMVLYGLWDAIKRVCDDWQLDGRSIAIYSDELRDLAGLGDTKRELVREMADQGRSRGVLPNFATQRPEQLPPATASAVLGFYSRIYFSLRNHDSAKAAAEDLDEVYSATEIKSLKVGECAAMLSHSGTPQAAFTLYPEDL